MSELQNIIITNRQNTAAQREAEEKIMLDYFPGFKKLNLMDQMKFKKSSNNQV